jgi:hypothetical protein
MKRLLLVGFFLAAGSIVARNASAQAERLTKTPRETQPLARHSGNTFNAFGALLAARRGLAAGQNATAHESAANIRDESIITFDVPASDGNGTLPVAVNVARTIVGNYFDSNFVSHGFLRNADGTFATFDAPGAGTIPSDSNGTFPTDINQFGTVAGYYNDANLVSHCFIRSGDGNIATFDVPGADINPADAAGSIITGISSFGIVAGYHLDSNFVAHGFFRSSDGKFTSFDAPGSGAFGTFPVSPVNIQGAVAGLYTDPNQLYHAFVRNPDGTFTTFVGPSSCDTGIETGCPGTAAYNINAGGKILGAYADNSGNFVQHGLLRDRNGRFTTLEAPGAGTGIYQGTGSNFFFFGTIPGLNNSGAITATYLDANDVFHGFLRKPDGTFVTFDAPGADLTPGNFNGTVPGSINELGVITGFYFDSRFVPHGFAFTSHP